jgi:Asp-tRNA(Asn)/Glu-tRNA(Gln) amidotransferase C subunit
MLNADPPGEGVRQSEIDTVCLVGDVASLMAAAKFSEDDGIVLATAEKQALIRFENGQLESLERFLREHEALFDRIHALETALADRDATVARFTQVLREDDGNHRNCDCITCVLLRTPRR